MGGDFCDLQAKLESAKGAHLLNTDRLAYNERALRELRPETQATLADQKRRIAFQKEHIAKLKVPCFTNLPPMATCWSVILPIARLSICLLLSLDMD